MQWHNYRRLLKCVNNLSMHSSHCRYGHVSTITYGVHLTVMVDYPVHQTKYQVAANQ